MRFIPRGQERYKGGSFFHGGKGRPPIPSEMVWKFINCGTSAPWHAWEFTRAVGEESVAQPSLSQQILKIEALHQATHNSHPVPLHRRRMQRREELANLVRLLLG
jgi:hypothetical protein